MDTTEPRRKEERGHATSSATDVARYFLAGQDDGGGERITHLKLQKLLYYAQGYYFALFGEPLFSEAIEAWDHGPVVREIYDEYKHCGRQPLPLPKDESPAFSQDIRDLLDNVAVSYGRYSALGLRDLTHKEAPWKDAFARGANSEITPAVMGRFFRSRLSTTPPRRRTWAEALENPRFRRAVDEGLADLAAGRTVPWSEVEPSLPSI
jgi:uncharacterized phage-associated protein